MRKYLPGEGLLCCLTLILVLLYSCERKAVKNEERGNSSIFTLTSNQGEKEITLKIPNYPLKSEADLDVLIKEIGDARIVLLGEASHGTAEYYEWREALSKRLIQEKGFNFIAVEGEWADSYRVNNFVKGERKDTTEVIKLLKHYNRWPTWMWGNHQVASLVYWLNNHNQGKPFEDKVGFFGLDVYCLWESIDEIKPYLKTQDAALLQAAQKVDKCFEPYQKDAQQYALAVANASANCRAETNRFWNAIQKNPSVGSGSKETRFVVEQNMLVALNAEKYYRTMVYDNAASWNIRDRHMTSTLKRLLELHGPQSKAIVWEHNTHVGDARYTDMAKNGTVNVGQLVRKEFGEDNVFILGFGSNRGTVIAADKWGSDIKIMEVPEAKNGSWEQILHKLSAMNKIILSKDIEENKYLKRPILHRAIGVVYNPKIEELGNYVPSIIPKRYDAFLYIDSTTALGPLQTPVKENEPPDLYPEGV